MNSTDRLRALYPEFLQQVDPLTEAVVAALDTVYSAKAPEQVRTRIEQLPRQLELRVVDSSTSGTDAHGLMDGKLAQAAQLHPRRQRLGVPIPSSKHVISAMTFTMVAALVLLLVFAAAPSLRRISPTAINYGVGNTAQPTACELAASRFPKGIVPISKPDKNQVHIISATRANADQVVVITSRLSKPRYHDAYVVCSATPYQGSRVQMSAEIRLDSVSASAGLSMIIADAKGFNAAYGPLRVDPMQDRAITGSTGWRTYSVVLDVPKESAEIKFGPWIEGAGTLSIQRLRFASVGRDVAVTNYTPHPRNLDFTHGLTAWFPARSASNAFTTALRPHTAPNGGVSLAIQAKAKNARQFGTLLQVMSATHYLGKRVRFSIEVKTEHMTGPVQLWMRVDGTDRALSFDNMQNRPITGTTAWRRYSIVLAVPRNSETINFGILFFRTGRIWMANGSLTPVDKSVPTT